MNISQIFLMLVLMGSIVSSATIVVPEMKGIGNAAGTGTDIKDAQKLSAALQSYIGIEQIGSEQNGFFTLSIYEIDLPSTHKGKLDCTDAKYCIFKFDSPTEVVFKGYNGGKDANGDFKNMFSGGSHGADRVADNFRVRSISFRKEFFDNKIFVEKDSQLQYNVEKLSVKDQAKYGCDKLEDGSGFCRLYFDEDGVKRAAGKGFKYDEAKWSGYRGFIAEIDGIETSELIGIDEIYLEDAHRYSPLFNNTKIKLNGLPFESLKNIDKISTIEYDFAGNIVPIGEKVSKDITIDGKIIKKGTRFEFALKLLVETADGLKEPKHNELVEKLNKILTSGKDAKIKKYEFNTYMLWLLHEGMVKVIGGSPKFTLTLPDSGAKPDGLSPTDLILNWAKDGETLEYGATIQTKADAVVGGYKSLKVNVEAQRTIYPMMEKYAKELQLKGIRMENGQAKDVIWPEKLDEKSVIKTESVFEENYPYTGSFLNEEKSAALNKLPNGVYTLVGHINAQEKVGIFPEIRSVGPAITEKDEVFQFELSLEVDGGASSQTILTNGVETTLRLVDIGNGFASIQVDDEECTEVTVACTLAIDKSSSRPFFRVIKGNILILAMETPGKIHSVVLTIVPLGVKSGKGVQITDKSNANSNLIKNIRIVQTSKSSVPVRKIPRGEAIEFTAPNEKIVFNFDYDQRNSDYLFQVFEIGSEIDETTGELKEIPIYQTSSPAANYRKKGEDVALDKTKPEPSTEYWKGNSGSTGSVVDTITVKPGNYRLRILICTFEKTGEKSCRLTDAKTDEIFVTLKVDNSETKIVEKAPASLKVVLDGMKIGTAMTNDAKITLQINQGGFGLGRIEYSDGEYKMVPDGNAKVEIPKDSNELTIKDLKAGTAHMDIITIPDSLAEADNTYVEKRIIDLKEGENTITIKPTLPKKESGNPNARKIHVIGPVGNTNDYDIPGTYHVYVDGTDLGELVPTDSNAILDMVDKNGNPIPDGKSTLVQLKFFILNNADARSEKAIVTLTKSKEVQLYADKFLSAKGPELLVKIINIPNSGAMAGITYDIYATKNNWDEFLNNYHLVEKGKQFTRLIGPVSAAISGFITGRKEGDNIRVIIRNQDWITLKEFDYEMKSYNEIIELDYSDLDFQGAVPEVKADIASVRKVKIQGALPAILNGKQGNYWIYINGKNITKIPDPAVLVRTLPLKNIPKGMVDAQLRFDTGTESIVLMHTKSKQDTIYFRYDAFKRQTPNFYVVLKNPPISIAHDLVLVPKVIESDLVQFKLPESDFEYFSDEQLGRSDGYYSNSMLKLLKGDRVRLFFQNKKDGTTAAYDEFTLNAPTEIIEVDYRELVFKTPSSIDDLDYNTKKPTDLEKPTQNYPIYVNLFLPAGKGKNLQASATKYTNGADFETLNVEKKYYESEGRSRYQFILTAVRSQILPGSKISIFFLDSVTKRTQAAEFNFIKGQLYYTLDFDELKLGDLEKPQVSNPASPVTDDDQNLIAGSLYLLVNLNGIPQDRLSAITATAIHTGKYGTKASVVTATKGTNKIGYKITKSSDDFFDAAEKVEVTFTDARSNEKIKKTVITDIEQTNNDFDFFGIGFSPYITKSDYAPGKIVSQCIIDQGPYPNSAYFSMDFVGGLSQDLAGKLVTGTKFFKAYCNRNKVISLIDNMRFATGTDPYKAPLKFLLANENTNNNEIINCPAVEVQLFEAQNAVSNPAIVKLDTVYCEKRGVFA